MFKIVNYLFLNTNFALKRQRKCWKDDVVTFTAHLSITSKYLTSHKQKVLAAILEGKSIPSNMAAYTNHTTLWQNQSAINISLKCVSSQISGVRWFLCSLSIFGISKIPTHCFKEALVMWPLSASGLCITAQKELEFQLVLWVSSFHILLAQGHSLLIKVNDFVGGWIVWTFALLASKL